MSFCHSFVETEKTEELLRHLTELTGSIIANYSLLTDETQCALKKNQNLNYSYTLLGSKLTITYRKYAWMSLWAAH